MSEDKQPQVDTSSAEFQDGVEAGLNSSEDTRNWQAGNDLGQELKDEPEQKTLVGEHPGSAEPLFMRTGTERKRVNDQDEKDETEE